MKCDYGERYLERCRKCFFILLMQPSHFEIRHFTFYCLPFLPFLLFLPALLLLRLDNGSALNTLFRRPKFAAPRFSALSCFPHFHLSSLDKWELFLFFGELFELHFKATFSKPHFSSTGHKSTSSVLYCTLLSFILSCCNVTYFILCFWLSNHYNSSTTPAVTPPLLKTHFPLHLTPWPTRTTLIISSNI